jgi:hypothetical protein
MGWGKRGEMTQILYAHMNKIKIKKKEKKNYSFYSILHFENFQTKRFGRLI